MPWSVFPGDTSYLGEVGKCAENACDASYTILILARRQFISFCHLGYFEVAIKGLKNIETI